MHTYCKHVCICTYMCTYILIDDLREVEANGDITVSSSASDTTEIGKTAAMTSNVESEFPSTDQGILYARAKNFDSHMHTYIHIVLGLQNY